MHINSTNTNYYCILIRLHFDPKLEVNSANETTIKTLLMWKFRFKTCN